MNIESFERSFRPGVAGCRVPCECGKTFYDVGNAIDWEEHEFENLEADENAVPVDYSIGYIEFEGRSYAETCDCWHERAEKLMKFLDGHSHQIIGYFSREKKRLQKEADHMPEMEPGS